MLTLNFNNAYLFYYQIDQSSLTSLKKSLFLAAIRYAHIRAEWSYKSTDEKADTETERTASHNHFIDTCNILSRNQAKIGEDNSWRKELGENRKIIGDFACYIHLFIGIKSR